MTATIEQPEAAPPAETPEAPILDTPFGNYRFKMSLLRSETGGLVITVDPVNPGKGDNFEPFPNPAQTLREFYERELSKFLSKSETGKALDAAKKGLADARRRLSAAQADAENWERTVKNVLAHGGDPTEAEGKLRSARDVIRTMEERISHLEPIIKQNQAGLRQEWNIHAIDLQRGLHATFEKRVADARTALVKMLIEDNPLSVLSALSCFGMAAVHQDRLRFIRPEP